MTTEVSHPKVADPFDLANISRTEFLTAIVHLYRGELSEATAWRSRTDTTSYWAIVLSATSLTFIFSDKSSQRQVLIPLISLFVTFLLLMEARRYRFFDIWRTRARMIEINFYRPLLDGSTPATPHWKETLAQDMEWPRFHMPLWEAAGRRLRRNYQWIYIILFGSWLVELSSYPTSTASLTEIVSRAAIGPLSGQAVFALMVIFYAALLMLGVFSFYESRMRKNLPAGHPGRMSVAHLEDA